MSTSQFLYLSRADVEAVAADARDHRRARSRLSPARPGQGRDAAQTGRALPARCLHPRDALLHPRPGGRSASSGWPATRRTPDRGLPYITGLLVLNDADTGLPLAVMDCTWITAKRTGAATALAARYLARPDSQTIGILGCGVQGRSNFEALNVLFPVKRVMAFDNTLNNALRYAEEIEEKWGVEVEVVDSPRKAVSGCDIVVTAGPILRQPHATIKAGWLDEGAFASLVDFNSYWDGPALLEVDKFCTDDVPQLEHYEQVGYFQHIPPVYASLGELVNGYKPGRQSAEERTMAANLGLALDDMATAPIVYKRAMERGIGRWLPL